MTDSARIVVWMVDADTPKIQNIPKMNVSGIKFPIDITMVSGISTHQEALVPVEGSVIIGLILCGYKPPLIGNLEINIAYAMSPDFLEDVVRSIANKVRVGGQ